MREVAPNNRYCNNKKSITNVVTLDIDRFITPRYTHIHIIYVRGVIIYKSCDYNEGIIQMREKSTIKRV